MKFMFKGSGQITLPITPESFQVETARNVQKVNVHEIGDVNLPGNMALGVTKISCMFPKQNYPFAFDYGNPYEYVEKFQKLVKKGKAVRFIISGTEVNERVLVESISYGERDGTGDVYATITLVGYRGVGAVQAMAVAGATAVLASAPTAREAEAPPASSQTQSYTVKAPSVDTYIVIARQYYQNHWGPAVQNQKIAAALAQYNGDKGSFPSQKTVKIPPYESLGI